jgi:hypothetical protein
MKQTEFLRHFISLVGYITSRAQGPDFWDGRYSYGRNLISLAREKGDGAPSGSTESRRREVVNRVRKPRTRSNKKGNWVQNGNATGVQRSPVWHVGRRRLHSFVRPLVVVVINYSGIALTIWMSTGACKTRVGSRIRGTGTGPI